MSLFGEANSRRGRAGGRAEPVRLRSVAVFDELPDLLRGVAVADAADLARIRAPVVIVERGRWRPPHLPAEPDALFGLLLLDGAMLRRVSLNGRTGAELLGSGDLLQPWRPQPPYDTLTVATSWESLERCRLAVLDQHFAARIAPWPEIAAALLASATERARSLAFQHVASHIPGLEARLVALMSALADRWGRVTPAGMLIPLRLTHFALAELVGASRPSVSTALSELARTGTLKRRPHGWLLADTAPDERLARDPRRSADQRALGATAAG